MLFLYNPVTLSLVDQATLSLWTLKLTQNISSLVSSIDKGLIFLNKEEAIAIQENVDTYAQHCQISTTARPKYQTLINYKYH